MSDRPVDGVLERRLQFSRRDRVRRQGLARPLHGFHEQCQFVACEGGRTFVGDFAESVRFVLLGALVPGQSPHNDDPALVDLAGDHHGIALFIDVQRLPVGPRLHDHVVIVRVANGVRQIGGNGVPCPLGLLKRHEFPPIRVCRDPGKEGIILGHAPEATRADVRQDQSPAEVDVFLKEQPPRTRLVARLESRVRPDHHLAVAQGSGAQVLQHARLDSVDVRETIENPFLPDTAVHPDAEVVAPGERRDGDDQDPDHKPTNCVRNHLVFLLV